MTMILENISGFDSEPFKFWVDGKSFYIHRARVASVSKPLERLMNAQHGEAILKDVDGPTFIRFCQWAYAGLYSPGVHCDRPRPQGKEVPPTTTNGPARAVSVLLESPPPSRTLKRRKPHFDREGMKEAFLKLRYLEVDDERPVATPRANVSAWEDYTEVFLSHVRVYMFAEKYDIQPLKRLALQDLHETMARFTLWPECVEDVVALIRLAYTETSRLKCESGDPMRSMLKAYMAYEMDVLIETVVFRDLLAENRDFLDEFCHYVSKKF